MYDNVHLRNNNALQHILYDTPIQASNLIMPYCIGKNPLMQYSPYGIETMSQERVLESIQKGVNKGLQSILLVGYLQEGISSSQAILDECKIIVDTVSHIKKMYPNLLTMVDICTLISNKQHAYGIVRNGSINIDATIDIVIELAMLCAKAGCDVLVHSGMIHNLTKIIKKTLQSHSIYHVAVMGYAMQSSDIFSSIISDNVGRREDIFHSSKEHSVAVARHEIESGVDILGISPITFSLDIVTRIAEFALVPIIGLQTNKEYAMFRSAVHNALISEKEIACSSCIRALRSGVKLIITPYATALLDVL